MFEGNRISLCLHFHGAIVAVADEAVESEPLGVRLGKQPEPNALYVPKNLGPQPSPLPRVATHGVRGATTTDTLVGASGIARSVLRTRGK